jgi:cell wall-associated NlpC family hydrolase
LTFEQTPSYNKAMKRLFLIFVFIFTLFAVGCSSQQISTQNPNNSINIPSLSPEPIPTPNPLPSPTPDVDDSQTDFDEEEEKKRYYAVSTTNGLRIRSGASTNNAVVGYLDKNDAVLLISEENGFYKTVYKEKTAYVSKKYCTVMEIDAVGEKQEKAIEFGCSLLGYPYVWGSQRYHWGNGKLNSAFVNGEFDCSAFVQYIYYKTNGVILDVNTRTQVYNGREVERENLARGDLMFFTNQSRKDKVGIERIGHVAIYLGNNYILHTATDHAVIEPISPTRWSYYITTRRVV